MYISNILPINPFFLLLLTSKTSLNILHEFSSNRFERIDTEGTIFIGFTRDISLRGIRFREHSKENIILSSNSEILSQK